MIVQRLAPHQICPFGPQRGKELLRLADPGKGQHPLPVPVHPHLQRLQLPGQVRYGHCRPPLFGKACLCRLRPHRQQQVSPRQPVCNRLAQRPGGQAAAVAKALHSIHHHQRQVLEDSRVLKAVVQHDHLCPAGFGHPHPGGAVAGHHHRGKGGQKQRLVAHLCGAVTRAIHPQRPGLGPAVAARHHPDRPPACRQPLDQCDCGGCLAGAAGIDVPDTDHRHACPVSRPPQPPRRCRRIDSAQRGQQARG